MKRICIVMSVCFCVLFLSAAMVSAEWSSDPSVNTPVVTVTGEQKSQKIVHDGQGGYFVVWHDQRDGNWDIYAQHFDNDGEAQWAENGIVVCDDGLRQQCPKIILDGSGGIIISWEDDRSGNYDIYAQRIDAGGNPLWTANGVPVIATTEGEGCGWLVSDGTGGAIIMNKNSSVNRIDGSGMLPWGAADDPIFYSTIGILYGPKLLPDGSGGAILFWCEGDDIAVQRVDNDGNLLWNSGDPVLLTNTGEGKCPQVVSDGSGGAIVMWMDERNTAGEWQLYGQRINGNGVAQWTANGVQITSVNTFDYDSGFASDGEGGAFVTWIDETDFNVYARRIDSNGSLLWSAPVQLTTTGDFEDTSDAPRKTVEDGSGGFITVWKNDSEEILAQRVDKDGTALWTDNGVVLCNALGERSCPRIVGNGKGGSVAVWWDGRDSATTGNDIYIQGITEDGELGKPAFFDWWDSDDGNCFITSVMY